MPKSATERTILKKLSKFPRLEILHNTRPEWLLGSQGERLELDFYLPQLAIAIEVQGEQHARFIPHFHGDYSGFKSQIRRDVDKAKLCKKVGLRLIEVWGSGEVSPAIKEVEKEYRRFVSMPSTESKAYKVIFNHLVTMWKNPKRAKNEQSLSLMKLVATEWGISVKEIMVLFEPKHKMVLKQAISFHQKGMSKERYANTLRKMALRDGMTEDQAELLVKVVAAKYSQN